MSEEVKGLVGALVVILFLCFLSWVTPASAHSWYDEDCCNQKDCAPVISKKYDKVTKNWTMTTKHGTVTFSMKNMAVSHRASQDQRIHVCMIADHFDIYSNTKSENSPLMYARCVYWPGLG